MSLRKSLLHDYNSHVSRASVSELKARLSHYLREVSRGGEVEILDRGVPVARLTRADVAGEAGDERRERLVKAGLLRAREVSASEILKLEPLTVSTSILAALEEERADRL